MAVTNYYTVNGALIGEKTAGGSRTDYLTDALGSVTATVNQSGQVVNTYRYKPYGAQLAKTGTGADPAFQWVGSQGYRQTSKKYSDVYVRARHYDSRGGRWATVDRLWPNQPAYGYVSGRPTLARDSSGLYRAGGCCCCPTSLRIVNVQSIPPPHNALGNIPITGPGGFRGCYFELDFVLSYRTWSQPQFADCVLNWYETIHSQPQTWPNPERTDSSPYIFWPYGQYIWPPVYDTALFLGASPQTYPSPVFGQWFQLLKQAECGKDLSPDPNNPIFDTPGLSPLPLTWHLFGQRVADFSESVYIQIQIGTTCPICPNRALEVRFKQFQHIVNGDPNNPASGWYCAIV